MQQPSGVSQSLKYIGAPAVPRITHLFLGHIVRHEECATEHPHAQTEFLRCKGETGR
jgi:hypothetical protein